MHIEYKIILIIINIDFFILINIKQLKLTLIINNIQILVYNLLNREKSMLNDEKVFILFGFFNRK